MIDSESLREFYENLGYEVNEESEFDGVPYYDMSRTPYGESDEKIGIKTPEQLGKEWDENNGVETFNKNIPTFRKDEKPTKEEKSKEEKSVDNREEIYKKEGIGNIEQRETLKTENFKLADSIREVIRKLDTYYTRYVQKGSTGTFYPNTENIAIQSINDIDTVTHELSHVVDIRNGVVRSKQDDPQIASELERAYYEMYP